MTLGNRRLRIGLLLVLGALSLGTNAAWADSVGPGFDLFATVPGGGPFLCHTFATIVLIYNGGGSCGGTSAQPVLSMGQPVGPFNTDTILHRTQGINPFNTGDTGTIPIELVALSLQSVAPVRIPSPNTGRVFDMLSLTLQPNTISSGLMTVRHENSGGGTFDYFIDVFVQIKLIDTHNSLFSETIYAQDSLFGSGTWSHTPPPGYPMVQNFPSGGFYPAPLTEEGSEVLFMHNLTPARTPEPGTLTLLVLGLSGLAIKLRRK